MPKVHRAAQPHYGNGNGVPPRIHSNGNGNGVPDSLVSLHTYTDMHFCLLEESVDRRFHAADKEMEHLEQQSMMRHTTAMDAISSRYDQCEHALTMARDAIDRRLEAMNEFRLQMKDQEKGFATILMVEERFKDAYRQHDSFDTRIKALEQAHANNLGKLWAMGVAITVISILVSILLKLYTF